MVRIQLGTQADIAAAVTADQTRQNATYAPLSKVADAGYDVVLTLGQSNMEGKGLPVDTARIDISDPRVFQFAQSGAYSGVISQAVEPLGYPLTASGKGPAHEFARWYAGTVPENRRVLLVPCAVGGTGFATSSLSSPPAGYEGGWGGCWEVGNTNGVNLYENAIAACVAALAVAGPNSRVVAFLWHQGEADGNLLTSTQYAARLDALIGGLRSRLPAATDVPFILGQLMPEYLDIGSSGVQGINTAHIDTPYRKLRTACVLSPRGYSQDSAHFTAAGQRIMGRRYFDALPSAQANVLGVAPVTPGAITFVQSGTTLTATWARPVGRVTDYVIETKATGASTWTTVAHTRSLLNSVTLTGLTLGSSYDVRVSTVNEQGTSSPTTVATRLMLAAPAQVTGLAAGTPTSSAVPLSWTAVADATSYRVDYRLTGAGSWTTGPTVTGTIATVTGLTASSGYDFRVTALGDGGASTASATATATTADPSVLLTDVAVTALAAYSLRKLKVGATSAVQVRRTSDNATMDVGFTGNDLNTAALLTWAGTDSVYITKWYDQSGAGRDVIQATTTAQPKLVTAGVLETVNGKACAVFDGVDDVLTLASFGVWAAGAAAHLAVAKPTAPASGLSSLWSEGGSGRYMPLYAGTTGVASSIAQNSSGVTIFTANSGAWANSAAHQHSFVDSGTVVTTWLDAAAAITGTTYSRSGHTLSPTTFALGASYQSGAALNFYLGRVCEVVVFGVALTTGQRQAGEQSQKGYWSTP